MEGIAVLKDAGQPILVRSKPALLGARLYANRLRLAFKDATVFGVIEKL